MDWSPSRSSDSSHRRGGVVWSPTPPRDSFNAESLGPGCRVTPQRSPVRHAALAGAAAAAVWAACDPALSRAFDPRYATTKLLGGRGVRAGVAAACAEHLALWPLMALLDRVHPARRSGELPALFANGRVFAHETAGHVAFGLALGALTRRGEPAPHSP